MGKLGPYQAKRDFDDTPEPAGQAGAPEAPEATGAPDEAPRRFVVQQHHARRLHWDFRLERDGVLVSWAVPRGIPEDPRRNHLAVHVEDHPLEYAGFEGEIPKGSYGAGRVEIWDSGTYDTHKWRMDGPKKEVMVTLHGRRARGRYVLFQTRDRDWMMHRMGPPEDPGREEMPQAVQPMLARLAGRPPRPDEGWAYEFKWDGIRAVVLSEGGSLRVVTRTREDVTGRYPELRGLAGALGSHAAVLDGEIVALGPGGVPSFEELQQRIGLSAGPDVRRKMKQVPVYYMAFDLLYLDGRRLTGLPYAERRRRLLELGLDGPNWQTPPHQEGDGATMLRASLAAGLEGVIAKRRDSPYEEGRRSGAWLKIKNHLRQDLVVGGWEEGQGRRLGLPGALLLGHWEGDRLVYAGQVGTGFTDAVLGHLDGALRALEREGSPFAGPVPPGARFVEPVLVADVQFTEWTRGGHVRAATFRGLRPDRPPREVVRERPGP